MALFNFGKKNAEEKQAPSCCGSATGSETTNYGNGIKGGIANVKVLGAGCKSCHELYENAVEAVKELGLGIEVEYITDMEKVMAYGVMSMPAIVVNNRVVSMGKVLKSNDLVKLLKNIL